jgi:hypothetical protein
MIKYKNINYVMFNKQIKKNVLIRITYNKIYTNEKTILALTAINLILNIAKSMDLAYGKGLSNRYKYNYELRKRLLPFSSK